MDKLKLNTHYFILTGAMGAGKSTILNEFRKLGLTTVDEPAREIIAEQREIDGDGIYERSPNLFYNLMLSRAIYQYKQYQNIPNKVIWDRGIADNIIHAKLSNINAQAAENAAKIYRYNSTVFYFPAWEEIYTNDEERKMSFLEAKLFGERLKEVYIELGYTIIDVPFGALEIRAKYILNKIADQSV